MIRSITIITIWVAFSGFPANTTSTAYGKQMPLKTLNGKVIQYTSQSKDGFYVVDLGRQHGLIPGEIITVYRPVVMQGRGIDAEQTMIETGSLKLDQVGMTTSLAKIESDQTTLSREFFPKFPGIMVGDIAYRLDQQAHSNPTITPIYNFTYGDLFEDESPLDRSFALHDEGKKKLDEAIRAFLAAKIDKLSIVGQTDLRGSRQDNFRESQLRAKAVKDYLLRRYKIKPDRILAVGLGEDGVDVRRYDPASIGRTITLKSLPTP